MLIREFYPDSCNLLSFLSTPNLLPAYSITSWELLVYRYFLLLCCKSRMV